MPNILSGDILASENTASAQPQQAVQTRSFDDMPAMRTALFDRVLNAAATMQPMRNQRHTLRLVNPQYIDPDDVPVQKQKEAILTNGSLGRRLRGTWELVDNATDTVLDRRTQTIAKVPYVTNRGTIVNNGNEYTVANQLRLRPGIFTRIKDNGEIEAHANMLPGKGFSHRYFLDPEKGAFYIRFEQAKIPLMPMLRALGATDKQLQEAWGNDLWVTNKQLDDPAALRKLHAHLARRRRPDEPEISHEQAIKEAIEKMEVDPDVTEKTLGKRYGKLNLESILATTKKLLAVSRGEQEIDDRDHLAFQTVLAPEDLFAERIAKDYGGIRKNLLRRASFRGDLTGIQPNVLSKQLESVLLNSGLANALEEINPADIFDQHSRVSRLGEGGIPSVDSVPDEARAVQPSHFGYIDPVRTPECYSSDTCVMTLAGWKLWPDVTADDELACRVDGQLTYCRPDKLVAARYCGEMYGAKSTFVSYLVTPNHRMYVKRRTDDTDEPFRILPPAAVSVCDHVFDIGLECTDERSVYASSPLGSQYFTEQYDGMVYCAQVPGGLLYVKRGDTFGHWSGNSFHAGVDSHIVSTARKGSDGRLYSPFIDARTGETVWKSPQDAISSTIAFPGELQRRRTKRVGAMAGGKLKFVPRDKVDLIVPTFENAFSPIGNMVPLKSGTLAQRMAMASRMITQALPLVNAESPYVQSGVYGENDKSYEDQYGAQMGAVRTEKGGTVLSVTQDQIVVRNDDGTTETKEIYNNFPYNRKSVSGDTRVVIWRVDGELWEGCIAEYVAKPDDRVLSADKETCMPAWQLITGYTKHKCDKQLYRVTTGSGRSVVVTEDHSLITLDAAGVLAPIYPKDCVIGQTRLPCVPFAVDPLKDGSGGLHTINARAFTGSAEQLAKWQNSPIRWDTVVGIAAVYDKHEYVYDFSVADSEMFAVNHGLLVHNTFLHNTPLVQPGQRVEAGAMLAKSNYTDDNGTTALGKNFRVAYIPYKGYNFEDAAVISESAAKRLTSEHMYQHGVEWSDQHKQGKRNFIGLFPGKYDRATLEKLDDDGIILPGTEVHYGDPLILAARQREQVYGKLHKKRAAAFADQTETWSHHSPGIVTDVAKTAKGAAVVVKSLSEMQVGDKLSGRYGDKSVVAAIVPDDQMPRDSQGRPFEILPNPLGVISRCYDEQTEFLTDRGWVFGRDVTACDKFACFNTATRSITMQAQCSSFHVADYSGPMLQYQSKVLDFCVTPNHKMWARCGYAGADWTEVTAERIFRRKGWQLPVAGLSAPGVDSDFVLPHIDYHVKDTASDRSEIVIPAGDWAELLGWYIAEGNTDSKVHISQSRSANPDKCARIEQLLGRLPFGWHYGETNTQYHLRSKRLCVYMRQFGLCRDKFIPDWLFSQTAETRQRFIDAYMAGDGDRDDSYRPRDYSGAGTMSRRLADDLQRLFVLQGVSASVQSGSGVAWRVGHHLRKYRTLAADCWSTVDYVGKIYCPTVPTGYVVTRRNGKLLIAGNTNPSQLIEVALGKIAEKTGKPYKVADFEDIDDLTEFAISELQKHGLSDLEDVVDPETEQKIPGILTGNRFFLKLMHTSESKGQGRGIGSYTMEGAPAKGGETGCFIGSQRVMTRGGWRSIGTIVDNKLPVEVLTYSWQRAEWEYRPVTNWFKYTADAADLVMITCVTANFVPIVATKQHVMYLADGTKIAAGDLKAGDMLRTWTEITDPTATLRVKAVEPCNIVGDTADVYDIEVADTHTYCAGPALVSNSKTISVMDGNALLSHGATEVIRDAAAIRGQRNEEYWLPFLQGLTPGKPKVPLVYEKFLNELRGAGINVVPDGPQVHIMALTNKDVAKLAGERYLSSGETLQFEKGMRPIKGGLFDEALTGGPGGNRWSAIKLHEPMPNPVMEEPIRRILGLTQKQLEAVIAGQQELHGLTGPKAIQSALQRIDLDKELAYAREQIKSTKRTARDTAIRKLGYLKSAKKLGIHPGDWMLDAVPVLPPIFRPVATMADSGIPLVSDPNYLYKELIEANDNLKSMSKEVDDLSDERSAVYNTFKAVTGLGDPVHPKLQEKRVRGLLQHVFGHSPKTGTLQRRLISSTVDVVGRAVITPDPELDMDSIGLPENRAWEVYGNFIRRRLKRRGMPLMAAAQHVKDRTELARNELLKEMAERPVIVNRAPVLHRFGIMAFYPKLTKGEVVRTSPLIVGGFGADYDGDENLNSVLTRLSEDAIKWVSSVYDPQFLEIRRMAYSHNTAVPALRADNLFLFDLEDFPHAEQTAAGVGVNGNIDF